MAAQRDAEQAIREWFQTLERCVRLVDYETARKIFAHNVLSFGTRADVVSGLDTLVANQWSGIWPHIRDFTIELDQLHWGASGDLGSPSTRIFPCFRAHRRPPMERNAESGHSSAAPPPGTLARLRRAKAFLAHGLGC